ncbi:protofilament ribbon protein of flagellar microtubules [Nannochloropsis oceanica]
MNQGSRRPAGGEEEETVLPLAPGLRRAPNPYMARALATSPGFSGRRQQQKVLTDSLGGLAMSSANGLDNSNHNFSHDAEIVASAVVDSPPPWLQKDDREVLRYYAYSHEPVYEGGDVNVKVFRVRYFTIYYFTSSGMLSVKEPAQVNSGITQGTYLRKQKVPKATCQQQLEGNERNPRFFSPSDFAVGATVAFYGRPLVITDADTYTREWHARTLGQPLGARLDSPVDGHRNQRLCMEQPLLVRRQKQEVRRQQEREQQGQDNAVAIPKTRKLLPYPRRDTKVLRFFCAFGDERCVGGPHRCVLYYYVGNQEMEIKETKEQGRYHFPNFLNRQQVLSESGQVYQAEDLRCGDFIKVYGRQLLLVFCDASTVEWYATRSISQVPLPITSSDSAGPPSNATTRV